MNRYLVTIRVSGQTIKSIVFADTPTHARLLVQYHFGMNSLVSGPQKTESVDSYVTLDEVIKSQQSLTPEKARLNQLKKQKELINSQIKSEKSRQQIIKAQKQIFKASH